MNIGGIYSSLEEAFEFCWSSLVDEHNTLPKSTRRLVKLDKFVFGTPWLPDSWCKLWFASSVWNFCRWVADVPPRETSATAKSEEKRMFSQATKTKVYKKIKEKWKYCLCPATPRPLRDQDDQLEMVALSLLRRRHKTALNTVTPKLMWRQLSGGCHG